MMIDIRDTEKLKIPRPRPRGRYEYENYSSNKLDAEEEISVDIFHCNITT